MGQTIEKRQPPEKQPIFNLPKIVLLLILLLFFVHIFLYLLISEQLRETIILNFAFLPVRFIAENQFDLDFVPIIWTIFTHSLIHASWEHLFINIAWLTVFGTVVAKRYGDFALLCIFFLSAAGGAILFAYFTLPQFSILIGASGGISGLMGVAIRFMFQPIRVAKDPETEEKIILGRSLATFRELFANKTSRYFIIFWVGFNLSVPLMPLFVDFAVTNIAWQAHLGGFLIGLFIAPFFEKQIN